jgi:hypothetical protein
MTENWVKNLLLFLSLLSITYVSMALWLPMTARTRDYIMMLVLVDILADQSSALYQVLYGGATFYNLALTFPRNFADSIHWDVFNIVRRVISEASSLFEVLPEFWLGWSNFTMTVMSAYTGHLIRLTLAVIFVGSYILRPLLMHPLSLIWLRIVQSDKPIFTMILGGMSGAVTAINEIGKHWSS